MSWNNALAYRKFKDEQAHLFLQYRAAGMTEEQIRAMYDFDLAAFNSERAFRTHNQPLLEQALDKFDCEESDNALLNKNMDALCVTIDDSGYHSRYWWLEEISNAELAAELKILSAEDLKLLTRFVFEQVTQKELAAIYGVSQQSISLRLKKIKNILSNCL